MTALGQQLKQEIQMKETHQIPWKRVAVEAAAIVASILLAFAIDAWWEERRDRENEQQLLQRLEIEFSENVERIDGPIFGSIPVDASQKIYGQIESALAEDQNEVTVPTLTLVRLITSPTFEADTPVLDSAVRSGQLGLIQDRSILAALSAWERLLRDYTELAQRARNNMDARLIPALMSRSDLGPSLMYPRDLSVFLGNSNPTEVTVLRIDEELKGAVAEKYSNGRHALNILAEARQAATEVVTAINAETARSGH